MSTPTPSETMAQQNRKRDPRYVVLIERDLFEPGSGQGESVTAWVVLAEDIKAKTDKAAIAAACKQAEISEDAQTRARFWAPLAQHYRPRTPRVETTSRTLWE
jgi:hypothetical protein